MVVENDEKKQCPYCSSKEVKLNGKTRKGKQRYLCLSCKHSYLWKQKVDKAQRKYQWFKKWIIEGYTIKQLSEIKKVSRSTVSRVINYWLEKSPPQQEDLSKIKYLIFDGTYINKRTGIYAVMNAENHKIVYAEYGVNENGKHLVNFYELLIKKGLMPITATIDGSVQQFKYLKNAWENLIIQRCIVHVQRQGLSWLRQDPKRTDARKLRELLLQIMFIKTREQANDFIKGFKIWESRFGLEIDNSKNRGWVFSDLLRTRSMITKALPYLFNYLEDCKIASTTNALEGYFGRLKQRYRAHRGLSLVKRKKYFAWYFYLKPI